MDQLAVVLKHSGRWSDQHTYDDYEVDGIVIRENGSFKELVELIASEIGINTTLKNVKIEYNVGFNCKPIEIRSDMGLKVYIMARKEERGIGMYPLCVSIVDKPCDDVGIGINSTYKNNYHPTDEKNDLDAQYVNECDTIVEAELAERSDYYESSSQLGIITDPKQIELAIEQVYSSKEVLKSIMALYADMNKFRYKVVKCNADGYTLRCKAENCKWYMMASNINKSGLFKIRKLVTEHTCPIKNGVHEQTHFTSDLVAGIVKPTFINHKRKYSAMEIKEDMKKIHGVDVSYMLAWRAREKALIALRGTAYASYSKLPAYLYTLNRTYIGSHIQMMLTEKNEFLYVYISLNSSIKGFDYCKPIVVVDGSHLRGVYNGTFVSASTLDGAGHIFPLAYGILDSENDATWTWFFEQFKQAYGQRKGMCVVSDRNESIIKAVSQVYGNVPHYACTWHLWKNVYKYYRKSHKVLTDVFYSMAKAYTRIEFDQLMSKVESVDVRVKKYLQSAGYEKWARVFSPVNRGWTMTSNIAETINKHLYDARELPVYGFLEEVRKMFGRWQYSNRREANFTNQILCGKFQEKLDANKAKSRRMTVVPATDFLYTVLDNDRRFIVCLEKKTCSCCRFQEDEIPCSHACAVLNSKKLTADGYCSDLYKPVTVLKSYEVPMNPFPDETEWEVPENIAKQVVRPPKFKRPSGRPKKKDREISAGEYNGKHSLNTCSKCGLKGHNRRSCSNEPLGEKLLSLSCN